MTSDSGLLFGPPCIAVKLHLYTATHTHAPIAASVLALWKAQ